VVAVALAVAGTVLGCAPNTTLVVGPRMVGHFANAGMLSDGVVAGQLESVRSAAKDMIERETGAGLSEKAQPYAEDLRAFARLAASAPDIESAASAVGRVGGACGSCHRVTKRGPVYEVLTSPPEGANPVATRMMRHQWAAQRLWDGLVGPSDDSWQAGAAVLKDAPLFTDELTQDVEQYGEVTKLAWNLWEVGALASSAKDQATRADLHGRLLATCADCHRLLRPAD
jgi:cytochrome c553